ncbi:MAG: GNAT family N-acetyltransferase, partial [Bacilli bacterium]|nr:GNAT family N-acetyltransferase [Bacilli bacterium]
MDITVEKLKREDLIEAVSIYDDNHAIESNIELVKKRFDELDNCPTMHNIVAKINGEVVGFATVIINYDIVAELKPFLTIWNVGVKKNKRRMGIATKMFEYIENFSKENDYLFISLVADKNNIG